MKRILSLFLVLMLVITSLFACGEKEKEKSENEESYEEASSDKTVSAVSEESNESADTSIPTESEGNEFTEPEVEPDHYFLLKNSEFGDYKYSAAYRNGIYEGMCTDNETHFKYTYGDGITQTLEYESEYEDYKITLTYDSENGIITEFFEGEYPVQITYCYEFDDSDRVTKLLITQAYEGDADTHTREYNYEYFGASYTVTETEYFGNEAPTYSYKYAIPYDKSKITIEYREFDSEGNVTSFPIDGNGNRDFVYDYEVVGYAVVERVTCTYAGYLLEAEFKNAAGATILTLDSSSISITDDLTCSIDYNEFGYTESAKLNHFEATADSDATVLKIDHDKYGNATKYSVYPGVYGDAVEPISVDITWVEVPEEIKKGFSRFIKTEGVYLIGEWLYDIDNFWNKGFDNSEIAIKNYEKSDIFFN